MMNSFVFKSLISACASSVVILSIAKASMAQVNTSFLTEVAESCQKDVFSSEYYQQLGHEGKVNPNQADGYLGDCIKSRYFYLQVISKFPWLVLTKEMLPGYSGSVAVTLIAYDNFFSTDDIDCLTSQDSYSEDCSDDKLSGLKNLYHGGVRGGTMYSNEFKLLEFYYFFANVYAYICPSCYVSYNNNPSRRKMVGSFIEWFMKLESSQKKELMSILGNEQTQRNNRANMKKEAEKAWEEYKAARRKMAEEEKERRRRELFGE